MTEIPSVTEVGATEASLKPAKSKGEKLFDRVVYGGLAGVGTLILTVPLAEALQHKWGWSKNMLGRIERGSEWLFSRALSPERSKAWAKEAASVTALMEGGNVMLLPVGILEHYKVPLVRGANETMGDTTPPEKIQETPKQTWMSLIQGRMTAWLVVFASITGARSLFKETFPTYIEECGTIACKLFKAPKMREVIEDGAKKMVESRPYKYGKIAALDVFATAAAATLLYVGGHFFARRHEEKKTQKVNTSHAGFGAEADSADATVAAAENANTPKSAVSGEKTHAGNVQVASEQMLAH